MSDVLPGVSARRSGRPRTSTRAWIFVVRPPREMPMAWARAPFCAAGTPVRLHIAAVDLGRLGDPALVGQRSKDTAPHTAPAPPVPTVVDRRWRTVIARAVPPAPSALEHVHDARDHSPVIYPTRSRLVLRQVRFNRRPRFIRQPKQRSRHARDSYNRRLPETADRERIKPLIGFGS
jgi:hypothetical protein